MNDKPDYILKWLYYVFGIGDKPVENILKKGVEIDETGRPKKKGNNGELK